MARRASTKKTGGGWTALAKVLGVEVAAVQEAWSQLDEDEKGSVARAFNLPYDGPGGAGVAQLRAGMHKLILATGLDPLQFDLAAMTTPRPLF